MKPGHAWGESHADEVVPDRVFHDGDGPARVTRVERRDVGANLGERETKPGEPYDLALVAWGADYPDPYDVLNVLLDSNLARKGEGSASGRARMRANP
jgi:hypothetical protein